jgi:hypothetical protein
MWKSGPLGPRFGQKMFRALAPEKLATAIRSKHQAEADSLTSDGIRHLSKI